MQMYYKWMNLSFFFVKKCEKIRICCEDSITFAGAEERSAMVSIRK